MTKFKLIVHIFGTFLFTLLGNIAVAKAVDIYVAPGGKDIYDGRDATKPVETLQKAKQIAKSLSGLTKQDSVNIYLAPGVYKGQSLVWDFDLGGAAVNFRALNSAPADSVVFDGRGGDQASFFVLRVPVGKNKDSIINTNIHFEGFTIRNYCEGISFGDYKTKAITANNSISNLRFVNIGSKFDPTTESVKGQERKIGSCVAAVRVVRAKSTSISNSTFQNIINLPTKETALAKYGPLHLHAIYLADFSDGTNIKNNKFENYSGSPIRIRNHSDDITIENNAFLSTNAFSTGDKREEIGAVSQWYCNVKFPSCNKKPSLLKERASSGIIMKGNKIDKQLVPYLNHVSESKMKSTNDTQLMDQMKIERKGKPEIEFR